jgi:glucose-6-phosphate isomerase
MKKSSSYKSLIGIGIIIAAVVVTYIALSKGPAESDSLLQSQATPEAAVVSARILNLLNQIKSLKIDTTLFTDPAYQTLVDYSVQIPPVDVGRPNPFAPIPGVPVTTQ